MPDKNELSPPAPNTPKTFTPDTRKSVMSPPPWQKAEMPRAFIVIGGPPRGEVIMKIPKYPGGASPHADADAAIVAAVPELIYNLIWLVRNPTAENRDRAESFLLKHGVKVADSPLADLKIRW